MCKFRVEGLVFSQFSAEGSGSRVLCLGLSA